MLVNPSRPIPAAATAVNGITNEMVANAPDEKQALESLLEFFDRYSNHKLLFVGHNANFDFSFLRNALNRQGITRSFTYFDTLYASRSLIKGLPNYKQGTVAEHLAIENEQAHRASSDALVCGKILLQLAPHSKKDADEFVLEPKNIPNPDEMAVCAYFQKMLLANGAYSRDLTYYKNSNGYITISSLYEIARFKFSRKGHYFIVAKSALRNSDMPTEDCTASEGGSALSRVFFTHPEQLSSVQEYFYLKYREVCINRDTYFDSFPSEKDRYLNQLEDMLQLSIKDMNQLINTLDLIPSEPVPSIKKKAGIESVRSFV